MIPARPAVLPQQALKNISQVLPGWDTRWSRLVTIDSAADPSGTQRTLHVLDTGAVLDELGVEPEVNLVAVHGNPTWSYLWRHVADATIKIAEQRAADPTNDALPIIRVIAPDQLDMGFSERLAHAQMPSLSGASNDYRQFHERIQDLDALVDTLLGDSTPPLFTLGHDWGGVISLGWASLPESPVTGMIALNTAVHQPEDAPVPAPLQAAMAGSLLPGSTVATTAFLDVTLSLGHPSLSRDIKQAYKQPYTSNDLRGGIGGFVADIPAVAGHRSHRYLIELADRLSTTSVPGLLLWGAKDPVFLDRYQHDLMNRIPQLDVHRYELAGHLLAEDVDISAPIVDWIANQLMPHPDAGVGPNPPAGRNASEDFVPLWEYLDKWTDSNDNALIDMTAGEGGVPAEVSWAKLSEMIDAIAVGLREAGMKPGDRVSLLVEPGRDLTAVLYAILRIGAVAVVADAGLGIGGMSRAILTAGPQWIIGELPGLTLARAQRWPGRRYSVRQLPRWASKALGTEGSIYQLALDYAGQRVEETDTFPDPGPDDDAAILFTSGSTGPAKGVRYTHGRISQLTQTIRREFNMRPGDSLLAGFAPFALFGPSVGATSVTPDMSVTKPATLTAVALADAAIAGNTTLIFASPAALRNVVATAHELNDAQRAALEKVTIMLSAGAPVPVSLMDEVAQITPNAEFRSPYGMTESIMVTSVSRQDLVEFSDGRGVNVGQPISVGRVAIAPLDEQGEASQQMYEGPQSEYRLGEVIISTPHMLNGYDKRWLTDHHSKRDHHDGLQWHRTGDIGHLDSEGNLWIEGRIQHVITTPEGPLGPGGPEDDIIALPSVSRCAVVGVGPTGTQAVVAVIEPTDRNIKPGLAPTELTDEVRAAVNVPVSAVLVTPRVPVDIRHNSKIDRTRLARWAEKVLTGARIPKP